MKLSLFGLMECSGLAPQCPGLWGLEGEARCLASSPAVTWRPSCCSSGVWLVTKTMWAGRVCAYRPHQEVELGFLLLGS